MKDSLSIDDMDFEKVIDMGKFSLFFLSGVAVGYGIKKIVDSEEFESLKSTILDSIGNSEDEEVHQIPISDVDESSEDE